MSMKKTHIIALVLAAGLAVSALVVFRPWERQTQLKLFNRSSYIILEETGDNLPIENVLVYAPFPEEFENLSFRDFWLETKNQGVLGVTFDKNGVENVLVNTLTGRSRPTFAIENTPAGKRAAVRIDILYPGDEIDWSWRFWAPENTSLYDEPEDMRCNVYVGYSPAQKTIKLRLNAGLYYPEYLGQLNENNLGTVWWRWQRYINSPGWTNAPTENILG